MSRAPKRSESSRHGYDGVFHEGDGRHKQTSCRRCGEEFVEGDLIHVQPGGSGGSKRRIYHKQCWEGMFV